MESTRVSLYALFAILAYANVIAAQAPQKPALPEGIKTLPDLPYVGGVQPLTQFVVATGWFLAMHRALQARGRPVEESGRLVYEVTEAYLQMKKFDITALQRAYLGE